MKPEDGKTNDIWCEHDCPHFYPWEHPYFHHCVWCSHQYRNLGYWDGTLADCLNREPQPDIKRAEDILSAYNNRG